MKMLELCRHLNVKPNEKLDKISKIYIQWNITQLLYIKCKLELKSRAK